MWNVNSECVAASEVNRVGEVWVVWDDFLFSSEVLSRFNIHESFESLRQAGERNLYAISK